MVTGYLGFKGPVVLDSEANKACVWVNMATQKMYANVACCLAPLPRQARNFGPTAKALLQEGGYWGISLQRDQTIHIVIPQAMIDTLW